MKGLSQDQHERLKNSEHLEFRLLATRWRFIVAPGLLVIRAVVLAAYVFMAPLLVVVALFCGIFDAVAETPSLVASFLGEKWEMLKQMLKWLVPIIVGKK